MTTIGFIEKKLRVGNGWNEKQKNMTFNNVMGQKKNFREPTESAPVREPAESTHTAPEAVVSAHDFPEAAAPTHKAPEAAVVSAYGPLLYRHHPATRVYLCLQALFLYMDVTPPPIPTPTP